MTRKPKRANLKGPGQCIFCEGFGLTHEHVYADWLRNYIPRTATEHTTQSILEHIDREEEVSFQQRTGDPHSRRIYCVCRACNAGWMSGLQTLAKPFLVPILLGQKTALHRKAQTILAAWIAMTTMVAEHVDRKRVAISQDDRHFLRQHQKAPSHWRILIGQHERQQYQMYTHRGLTFVTKEEFERLPAQTSRASNTQATTICLGEHLLIHAMSSVIARDAVRRWRFPNSIASGLTQIWPVKTAVVFWPPSPAAFTDAGIKLLANDFYERAKMVIRRRYAF